MLKRRIVAVLVIKDGLVVQSYGFARYLPVGRPAIAVEFLDRWGIDEIVLVDISASKHGAPLDPVVVREASKRCFVPITAGGGLRDLADVDAVVRAGADKVFLNSAVRAKPTLVRDIAHRYGQQCVVVGIDVLADAETGELRVYDHLSRAPLDEPFSDYLARVEDAGAGEVLLQAVHRDGAANGFDQEMARVACADTSLPVLVLGGAGHPRDFAELLERTPAQAACAANFFHFTEHSAIVAKTFVAARRAATPGLDVRLDTRASYQAGAFLSDGRVAKLPDDELERMLYVRVEPEII